MHRAPGRALPVLEGGGGRGSHHNEYSAAGEHVPPAWPLRKDPLPRGRGGLKHGPSSQGAVPGRLVRAPASTRPAAPQLVLHSDTEHMATPVLISLESTAPSGQTPASHHGPHLSDGKWAQRRDATSRGSGQARGGPWGVPPPCPPPPRSVPSST